MVHYGHPFPIHHFRSDVRLTLSLNYWAFKKIWISHKTFCCFTIRFGRSPGMGRSWISVLAAHQIGYFVHVRRVINLKRNYNEVMKWPFWLDTWLLKRKWRCLNLNLQAKEKGWERAGSVTEKIEPLKSRALPAKCPNQMEERMNKKIEKWMWIPIGLGNADRPFSNISPLSLLSQTIQSLRPCLVYRKENRLVDYISIFLSLSAK